MTEQESQVESAQKAADAAKQALETAKQEFDNLGGAQALQDAESKKTTAQKNVEQAEKDKDQTQQNLEAAQKELEKLIGVTQFTGFIQHKPLRHIMVTIIFRQCIQWSAIHRISDLHFNGQKA